MPNFQRLISAIDALLEFLQAHNGKNLDNDGKDELQRLDAAFEAARKPTELTLPRLQEYGGEYGFSRFRIRERFQIIVVPDWLQAMRCLREAAQASIVTDPPLLANGGREVEGGKKKTAAMKLEDTAKAPISRCHEKAYRNFEWAMQQDPTLKGDADVYYYLKEKMDDGDALPTLASFKKYLRIARGFYDTRIHNPRSARATGPSIVSPNQI